MTARSVISLPAVPRSFGIPVLLVIAQAMKAFCAIAISRGRKNASKPSSQITQHTAPPHAHLQSNTFLPRGQPRTFSNAAARESTDNFTLRGFCLRSARKLRRLFRRPWQSTAGIRSQAHQRASGSRDDAEAALARTVFLLGAVERSYGLATAGKRGIYLWNWEPLSSPRASVIEWRLDRTSGNRRTATMVVM